MRHRVAYRKLGRTTQHRISLLRNLAASLFIHERIRTTLVKAKELRPFAEKLITLSKKDSLHARRRALRVMDHKEAVTKLFRDLSARFADRPGGYTRILKLGPRRGDGAEMAFIELVDFAFTPKEGGGPAREPKKQKAEAKPTPAAEPESVEGEETSKKKKAAGKGAAKKKSTKPAAKTRKKKTAKKSTTRKKKKG